MIKTAIENKQNLIAEGCYIPFDLKKEFNAEYLKDIKSVCLVMSGDYIKNHFDDIKKYASAVENRLDDSYCTMECVLRDNAETLENCKKYGTEYLLIDGEYKVDFDI